MTTSETFIPYDQLKDYMLVDFVALERTEDSIFSDVMIVSYKDKNYKLDWNNHYSYYIGKVNGVEGYIP